MSLSESPPHLPRVTSPESLHQQQGEFEELVEARQSRRERSSCNSFRSTDGSDDLVVCFQWMGEPIGLELMRARGTRVTKVIHWDEEVLGITFGIEESSRKVIVTKTSRNDVRPGDILVSARGDSVNEHNFDEKMAMLKLSHSISRGIPFVFESPPPPVFVKTAAGLLERAGVDSTFELRVVNGRVVRYLSLTELHDVIRKARVPCEMIFVQRRESKYLNTLKNQDKEEAMAAAALATAAAVCVSIT